MPRAYLLAFATAALISAPAAAQVPSPAKLLVTVADPSGAVIPGATVSILGEDAATKSVTPAPVKASDKGLATIENLPLGRYTILAEFTGFEPGQLKNVALKSGDNRHVVILKIKSVEQSVQVSQDRQAAAANPRAAFGTTLTTEEIKGLSDDPAEMAQQLIDMAGGNAVIRVDSFLGGPLPPKALIRSIHIVRDAFAAENHSAESDEINIITQPGVGPLHGGGNSRLRDGSMSGKSPFTENKGPEQTQNYRRQRRRDGHSAEGVFFPLRRQPACCTTRRSSRSRCRAGRSRGSSTSSGRSTDGTTFDLFDYALTRDQILRFSYDQSNSHEQESGHRRVRSAGARVQHVSQDYEFRIQESGPLGRRTFAASRLELNWTRSGVAREHSRRRPFT